MGPTDDASVRDAVRQLGMPEQEARALTGSIVLAADDPAALARFYGALLGVEPQPGMSGTHWRVPWPAGGWLELYAPSRHRPQPRQEPFGAEAWWLDPEGNRLLLLVLPAPWRPTLGGHSGSAQAPKPDQGPHHHKGDRQGGDAADVPGQAAEVGVAEVGNQL
jgi:hypothetical protein